MAYARDGSGNVWPGQTLNLGDEEEIITEAAARLQLENNNMLGRSMSCRRPRTREAAESPSYRRRSGSVPACSYRPKKKPVPPKNEHDNLTEVEYYLVREFSLNSKGLLQRGDSVKKRKKRIGSASSDTAASAEDGAEGPRSRSVSRTSSIASEDCFEVEGSEPERFKIVILGAHGVGKTSLTQQFTRTALVDTFDTDSADKFTEVVVTVSVDGDETELSFHSITEDQIPCLVEDPSIDGALVVYSLADRQTYVFAEDVLCKIRKHLKCTCPVVLVANKDDLVRTRVVSCGEGKLVATLYDAKYIETSAVLSYHVDELLVGILHQIKSRKSPFKAPSQGMVRRNSAKRILKRLMSFHHGTTTPDLVCND